MMDIRDAVNIGPVLAEELYGVGIETLEQLRGLGYIEVWRRLRQAVPERDNVNTALLLAGAEAGVRWMLLSDDAKRQVTNAVGAVKLQETTRRRPG